MDPNINNNVEGENEQAGELLDQGWFFGNLLQTKSNSNSNSKSKSNSRMLRSFSDPSTCSSSSSSSSSGNCNFPGKSYEETYQSIKKGTKTASSSLVRAPSLPTTLDHDEDVEFSMGKLIRQASLNTRPSPSPSPNAASNKILTGSPSLSLTRHTSMRLKRLDVEELQGFKDLGLIEKKDLSLSPGLQERRRSDEYEERRAPRPYPPVPRWGRKRAPAPAPDDMKAQLKFWARAVASNVRQEC